VNAVTLEKLVSKILFLEVSSGMSQRNREMIIAYAKVALKGEKGKPVALFLAKLKFLVNLLRLHGCRIDKPKERGDEKWIRYWDIHYILQLGLRPDHSPQVFVCD
jgi:hypothetical protein